jgi:DNA-binding transcriptional LysR family regulator
MAAFMAQHPKVTLDVTLSDRVVDLVDEGYDLAVRIARLPASSLISRQLTSTRMVLCASPDYLRRHGAPTHPSELATHAVMAFNLLSLGENWAFDGPQGPVTVKISPRLRTNSGDTCRSVALGHGGIVLQPTFLVGAELLSGALDRAGGLRRLPDAQAPGAQGAHADRLSRRRVQGALLAGMTPAAPATSTLARGSFK